MRTGNTEAEILDMLKREIKERDKRIKELEGKLKQIEKNAKWCEKFHNESQRGK